MGTKVAELQVLALSFHDYPASSAHTSAGIGLIRARGIVHVCAAQTRRTADPLLGQQPSSMIPIARAVWLLVDNKTVTELT
jgi:hypothetical protein